MKVLIATAITAVTFMPVAAFADDASYCYQLGQTYRRVVGSNSFTGGPVPEAIEGCKTDPKSSIPILEKALRDNKVTLPKRD
ncbi:MAG: hypothetical protein J0H44_01535 [Alphaproteobacteria bacterium]|jgi:hypothetical protein|nr:hypothetical protein [Alphaproteobacteria bacterium]